MRTLAARRAARRGLSAAALRAAGSDAEVLNSLGMHISAAASATPNHAARVAQAASAAALGHTETASWIAKNPLSRARRRQLAAMVALSDPALALAILHPEDADDRAGCALAMEDFDLAEQLLPTGEAGQSARYQHAAVAAGQGRWGDCRKALNAAFVADGMSAPLEMHDVGPISLADFSVSVRTSREGPLVSVVMPVRNSEATLAIAARSILLQSQGAVELILVDDGSTDGSLEIARSLAAGDPRVTVLRNARSPGAYGARNTGVEHARGEFIALHDADDWAHPERFERQLAAISGWHGLVLGRHFRIDDGGRLVCPRVFPFVRLSPVTAMFRATALRALGPFEEVRTGADSEMVARFDNRFGRRAGVRLEPVVLVASWAGASLSRDPLTGMMGEGWRNRVSYVEDWRRRHAGIADFASPARSR